MHVTNVVVVGADPIVEAAAELVAAILGPAALREQGGASDGDTVTVGRAEARPSIAVVAPKETQDLAFFERVPRLRASLESVDVASIAEACVRICRGRAVLRKAPEAVVRARVDEHLRANNVCGFASGSVPGFRAIPIEYDWDGSTLAFVSEGGEKFARMALQPEVSVTVADRYTGFATVRGTQITGDARLLDEADPRVDGMLAAKGLSRERLAALPCRMCFFLVQPTRIEHLDAELAKKGDFDARQVV